jgi:phage gp36-like protein
MAYATAQDIIDRYSADQLLITFDRDAIGQADPEAVARALDDATAEIDGYLAGRYALPLSEPPRILAFMCVDIALYKGSLETAVTDERRRRYQDAIAYLVRVAKGDIALFSSDPGAPQGGSGASFSAGGRVFTRDSMKDLR